MTDKTLGTYHRTDSPDYLDGGVTSARIEEEAAAYERECGRGPCWRGDGHDGPCRPGGRPHPDDETDDDDMWSHVGLQLRPILPVFTRLDRERGDARAMASLWKETARRHINATRYWQDQHERMTERTLHMMARAEKAEEQVEDLAHDLEAARAEMEACDVHNGVVLPRPLTADDITDEMVERAQRAYRGTSWGVNAFRAVLVAALTEPPTRPEGAEEIERLIETSPWHLAGSCSAEADWLAKNGVRVVTEEER